MGMTQGKTKVVQTELEQEDYETLSNLARSRGMTIKEAAKEALRWWTASKADLREDPLFRLKPVEFSVRVRADEIDGFLYGKR